MVFVYPYTRKENDFLILESARLVKELYPFAQVFTVGDAVGGIANIPFKETSQIRGVNVTGKILRASDFFSEFVYMNDDFFINKNYDLSKTYGNYENLETKPKASALWNEAVINTKHWLNYNGYETRSFECHQPVIFQSKKLVRTFSKLDWQQNHFLKSIYFNVNPPKELIETYNNKLIKFDKKESDRRLKEYGFLSIGGEYLTPKGAQYIKALTARQ